VSGGTPVAVLNGPNLDQLGRREPEVYGSLPWPQLRVEIAGWAAEHGLTVEVHQCAGEGELVSLVHETAARCAGLVINPGAYTHTSVALRDALLCVRLPVVEVHLTNPARREDFRRRSLIADVVAASVQGFGASGYRLALAGLAELLAARG